MTHDIVIVGAGPAGLTAAIKAGTEGLSTVIIDREEKAGGRPVQSPLIENVPGWPEGISGPDLFSRLERQAVKFGATFALGQTVLGINRVGGTEPRLHVSTQGRGKDNFGHFEGRSVVLAMGEIAPKLDALTPFEGRGVDYSCDAALLDKHAGQHVVLVGGGNSCAQLGLTIAETDAKSVTIISRSPMVDTTSLYLRSRLARSRVKVIIGEVERAYGYIGSGGWDTTTEVAGDVRELKIARGETFRKTIPAEQVYVFIGGLPPTGWFAGALDATGYILTGHDVPTEDWPLERYPYPQESSIPGIFVAGDVRAGATGGITVAFGEGTQAFQWIKREFLPGLVAEREEAYAPSPT